MFRLILPLAGLVAYSYATPCNEAPPSALATISSVGGWIPEFEDTVFGVDQALGIRDVYVIPSLNQDIEDPNDVMAGSTYCVPYISPATSAYWSTSGTFPWLHLARPTNPIAPPTSALEPSAYASTSTNSAGTSPLPLIPVSQLCDPTSTLTSLASMSTCSASTLTSLASPPTNLAGTSSLPPTSASELCNPASLSTSPAMSASQLSTSTPTSLATAFLTPFSQTTLETSYTSSTVTVLSSLICGGNPTFSEIPRVDNGAHCDLGQCYTYCQIDTSCKAFGYYAEVGNCFLYESDIYYPAYASGSGDIYYWNLDCFTKTSIISTPTGSA